MQRVWLQRAPRVGPAISEFAGHELKVAVRHRAGCFPKAPDPPQTDVRRLSEVRSGVSNPTIAPNRASCEGIAGSRGVVEEIHHPNHVPGQLCLATPPARWPLVGQRGDPPGSGEPWLLVGQPVSIYPRARDTISCAFKHICVVTVSGATSYTRWK